MARLSAQVEGFELDRLDSALRHWREKMAARLERDTPLAYETLSIRHKSILASAAMGLPDLCEDYAKPPHERAFK